MDNSKYRRLDYITNVDNLTYIKIPVVFTQDTYMKYVTNILDLKYIGIMTAKTNIAEEVIIEPTNIWYDNNTKVEFGYNVGIGRHEFVLSGRGYVKVDGKELAQENTNKPDWSISYICVGSDIGYTTTAQKFIGLVLYDSLDDYNNENFSHNFVPCLRIEDKVVGVYDLVTDTFYSPTKGTYTYPMDFSKVTAIQIPEGNVIKIEDKEGNILWNNLNKYAYGIRWDSVNQSTSACERIGNLEFHKTLPIQSKFKVCVHQGTDIKYYCNPDDSRFVEESKRSQFTYQGTDLNITACDGLPTGVISCEERSIVKCKFINENLFSNYRFLYSYVYIRNNDDQDYVAIGRIVYIDTSTHEAYIADSADIRTSRYTYNDDIMRFFVSEITDDEVTEFTDNCTVEFGAVLNGYDGEIGVDTGGKFYQWSVDNEGNGNEVWISEYKCVSYAKEVKRHIIGCSRACVLNTAFNDTKWGWIGSLQANTAVNVINYHKNLKGGDNDTTYDKYFGYDNFRCQLNKGRSNISLGTMRRYTQKLPNHQILYKQLWEAILWCYYIEYADLDVKQEFNSALTTDGYRQGGLGRGYSVGGNNLDNYNNYQCFTPNDYTLHLGNQTGIVNRYPKTFGVDVASNHYWNYYNISEVDYSVSSDNKIVTISYFVKDNIIKNIISASAYAVGGTVTYKVTGLTDGQTIVFTREKGDLTITTDGTYDVEWGTSNAKRNIYFGESQEEYNIDIEIISASSYTLLLGQVTWDVPHWRGFNGFWYGDTWLNLENFLSKYDSTKQKRIYYWTDDVTKFDNTIDNKEHSIEDIVTPRNGQVGEFNLGNQGNLTPRSYGNGKNIYHFNNRIEGVDDTFVGGATHYNYMASLASTYCAKSISSTDNSIAFVTCTIID